MKGELQSKSGVAETHSLTQHRAGPRHCTTMALHTHLCFRRRVRRPDLLFVLILHGHLQSGLRKVSNRGRDLLKKVDSTTFHRPFFMSNRAPQCQIRPCVYCESRVSHLKLVPSLCSPLSPRRSEKLAHLTHCNLFTLRWYFSLSPLLSRPCVLP